MTISNSAERAFFKLRTAIALIATSLLANGLVTHSSWASFPQIGLQSISSGELIAPVALTNAGDGTNRIFVVDQRGKIQIIQNGALLPTPFLNIESILVPERQGFDERGLLGLAFHPDYGTPNASGEGKFYVYYSAPSLNAPGTAANPVDHQSVIAEYTASGGSNTADPNSARTLLTITQPQFNHDAGALAFGPDAMLFISTGDGGSSNDNNAGHTGGDSSRPSGVLGNAQDRTNLLGNILRIDPLGNNGANGQYGIPADNPFVGEGGGLREEIYANGLRNPWRMSFDRGTDRLFVADVGQNVVEEINIVESGGNYGWRTKEGTLDFDPTTPNPDGATYVDPIAEYFQPDAPEPLPPGGTRIGVAVTGGFVYRGDEIPELAGKYVFGDWSLGFSSGNGTLLGLEETAPDQWELSTLNVAGGNPIGLYINAFGEDESGELYVVARSNLAPTVLDPNTGLPIAGGEILKIVPEPATLSGLLVFSIMVSGRKKSH